MAPSTSPRTSRLKPASSRPPIGVHSRSGPARTRSRPAPRYRPTVRARSPGRERGTTPGDPPRRRRAASYCRPPPGRVVGHRAVLADSLSRLLPADRARRAGRALCRYERPGADSERRDHNREPASPMATWHCNSPILSHRPQHTAVLSRRASIERMGPRPSDGSCCADCRSDNRRRSGSGGIDAPLGSCERSDGGRGPRGVHPLPPVSAARHPAESRLA